MFAVVTEDAIVDSASVKNTLLERPVKFAMKQLLQEMVQFTYQT
jgi:hypothetical protein